MKICLIKPPILHKGASFALMPTPPLGLAYIAGVLKKEGYSLQVIDASAEGADLISHFDKGIYIFGLNAKAIINLVEGSPDIICFSSMFTNNWLHDREVIKQVKEKFPNSILIAGGEHANAAPKYCMDQSPLDYVVLGEGEETIKILTEHIKDNKDTSNIEGIAYRDNGAGFKINPLRKRITQIEDIPWPAWDLFPLKKYFDNRMSHGVYRGNTLPVMATRGCPYECTFCSNPQMWGRKYEMRPPKDFVDELEYLYNTYDVVNFDLFDLTAIIVKDWIVEMCNEIIDRGLEITYQLPSGTRSEAIDFEVAQLLYKSGCKNITYAPESGSERVLKNVKKKVKVSSMLESIKHAYKANVNIHMNMIVGFPDDTHKDIWATIWFILKASWYGANDVALAVFTPYPGSELFDRLSKEGKVNLYDDNCIIEIINSYDLWPKKVYSEKLSPLFIKLYVFLALIIFYGSNYLFRPVRFFRTIRNIITKKHESRLEQILYKNFLKNFFGVFSLSRLNRKKVS